MDHLINDSKLCRKMFSMFYDIGNTPLGGVTRLGYSIEEDLMHDVFVQIAEECGFSCIKDNVGNTFAVNDFSDNYYLIGSHLDSVIEGGRYDGVAGVIAGLMVLQWIKEKKLNIPVRVAAFRCEESSNFGICTMGSSLVTKENFQDVIYNAVGKDGRSVIDIFKQKGYTLSPDKISGIQEYLELHIEQGKVLAEQGYELGIVSTIAGYRRHYFHIHGMAEHSGATPMDMRNDALCCAAEIILSIESAGRKEAKYNSVATVGVINNSPNALNVIPGQVSIGVDLRGTDEKSIDRVEKMIFQSAQDICSRRQISLTTENINSLSPIDLSKDIQKKLSDCANSLNITNKIMPSGAGHDAMVFPSICPTAMIFIPCKKGISHNKDENAAIEDICKGARVMYEYLRRKNYADN